MKLKTILRLFSFIMLVLSAMFLSISLTHQEFGTSFRIGDLVIGSETWRAFYALYGVIMVGLFVSSFFAKVEKFEK